MKKGGVSMKAYYGLIIVIVSLLCACMAPNPKGMKYMDLQTRLTKLQTEHPDVPGFAMAAILQGKINSAAMGVGIARAISFI